MAAAEPKRLGRDFQSPVDIWQRIAERPTPRSEQSGGRPARQPERRRRSAVGREEGGPGAAAAWEGVVERARRERDALRQHAAEHARAESLEARILAGHAPDLFEYE